MGWRIRGQTSPHLSGWVGLRAWEEKMMLSNQKDCPVCGSCVALDDDAVVYERVECFDCGNELEVRGLEPLLLEEAPLVEDYWGDAWPC